MADDEKQKAADWEKAVAEEHATVSGFQQGVEYPPVAVTPDDFARLLKNPALPPENQSAPTPEQLNPHLFGPQGRIPS